MAYRPVGFGSRHWEVGDTTGTRLLARYDDLAALSRSRSSSAVLTHGEPHPGNSMLTSGGWLLIDWDTALLAPPERDLWILDPGDGSILGAYAEATGVSVDTALNDLTALAERGLIEAHGTTKDRRWALRLTEPSV